MGSSGGSAKVLRMRCKTKLIFPMPRKLFQNFVAGTRQFAKRQLTWFRRQLDPERIELKADDSPENILPRLKLV
jgi:hypothetical protein